MSEPEKMQDGQAAFKSNLEIVFEELDAMQPEDAAQVLKEFTDPEGKDDDGKH